MELLKPQFTTLATVCKLLLQQPHPDPNPLPESHPVTHWAQLWPQSILASHQGQKKEVPCGSVVRASSHPSKGSRPTQRGVAVQTGMNSAWASSKEEEAWRQRGFESGYAFQERRLFWIRVRRAHASTVTSTSKTQIERNRTALLGGHRQVTHIPWVLAPSLKGRQNLKYQALTLQRLPHSKTKYTGLNQRV